MILVVESSLILQRAFSVGAKEGSPGKIILGQLKTSKEVLAFLNLEMTKKKGRFPKRKPGDNYC